MYFDQRLLDYDASPKEILTNDKQQLVVDNYSRWRIVDPLQFYRTVRNEAGAQSRLDDIVYSNLRENLGRHTLREIVSEKRGEADGRGHQARATRRRASTASRSTDVRIKRADLPEKNELNVFNRMRTERERLAKKFRAEGDEEARKIRSESDKQVQILIAEARKQAEITRGAGRRAGGEDLRRRVRPRSRVLRARAHARGVPQLDHRRHHADPLAQQRVLPLPQAARSAEGSMTGWRVRRTAASYMTGIGVSRLLK